MSIASYSELLTQLGRMVTFEGENPGDASPGVLSTLLGIAENRIYRDVRTSYNMVAFGASDLVVGNSYTLPANFKAVASLTLGGPYLEPKSPAFVLEHVNDGGDALYFANQAGLLTFAPAVTDYTQLQGYYYAKLPALSAATLPSNALFNAANDLFIYAVMVEAAPMYGFEDQIVLWQQRYASVVQALNQEQQMTAYSAGRLKRRSVLMGRGSIVSAPIISSPAGAVWNDALTWDDTLTWAD